MCSAAINDFDHKKWLKSRTWTFRIYLVETCALGMEYSLTFITLWSYLKDIIQTDHLRFFYSIISCVYLLSQVAMSLIFSRIFDWNRNARLMISVGNFLIIAGNFLYIVPWSPWYPFAGRLISGGGGCLRSIITAEVARVFSEEELSKKYSFLGMSVALGFVVGPLLNVPFSNADFVLFYIPISHANAPGVVLGLTFVLIQILVFAAVSNLSKQYDLKLENQELENLSSATNFDEEGLFVSDACADDGVNGEKLNQWRVFTLMVSDPIILLLLSLSLIFMFSMVLFDLWLPMAATEFLGYSTVQINYIILGFGLFSMMQFIIFSIWPIPKDKLVLLAVSCVVAQITVFIIFLTMKSVHENDGLNVALFVLWDFMAAVVISVEEIFLITVMAVRVPSEYQASCESIRLAFSRFGSVIALSTATWAFDYMYLTASLTVSMLLVSTFVLILKKKKILKNNSDTFKI